MFPSFDQRCKMQVENCPFLIGNGLVALECAMGTIGFNNRLEPT